MDWQVLGICIVIGILLTIVGELFTEEMTWNTECDDKKNGECESLSEFAQRWW